MPNIDMEENLIHVAGHPRRQRDLATLAHLAHEYQFEADGWFNNAETERLVRMDLLLDRALRLESLFGEDGWPWSKMLAQINLRRPADLLKNLLNGQSIFPEDVPGLIIENLQLTSDPTWSFETVVRMQVVSIGRSLESLLSTANDMSLRRFQWRSNGHHDF
jgi:hypothetical protein